MTTPSHVPSLGNAPTSRTALAAHRAHRPRRRWPSLIAAVLALAASGLALGTGSAAAVEVSTDYPVINVQAGQDITVNLNFSAADQEQVALSVTNTPDGWTADLQGGGFTIGGVSVGPKEAPAVSLHVQIPVKAQTGTYHVVVEADAPSGSKKLDVQLNVVAQASNAYALTSQFDSLQGSTTDSFDFSLTLANNTGAKASFALTAKGPQGWTVTAHPTSQAKASAVDVDAGSKSDISVTANPPANVAAGTYPLTVTAQGKGVELDAKLSVQVAGSAALTMSTANQALNASGSAGETSDVHLTLQNTGTAPMTGVSLSSSPPSDWKVTFEPTKIDSIAPGKTVDVVAHVTPSGDAITGDYQVSLSAKSDASDGSVSIRYTVETSTWWGLVGVVIIVVVIVVLLWMFRKFGRR